MPEGINKKEQKPLRLVETEKQFLERVDDTQNQFLTIGWDLNKNLPVEELIEKNKYYTYLPFLDYIKEQGYELSQTIENNEECKQLVFIHDDLIKRVKKFESIAELKQILEEVDEFLKQRYE